MFADSKKRIIENFQFCNNAWRAFPSALGTVKNWDFCCFILRIVQNRITSFPVLNNT